MANFKNTKGDRKMKIQIDLYCLRNANDEIVGFEIQHKPDQLNYGASSHIQRAMLEKNMFNNGKAIEFSCENKIIAFVGDSQEISDWYLAISNDIKLGNFEIRTPPFDGKKVSVLFLLTGGCIKTKKLLARSIGEAELEILKKSNISRVQIPTGLAWGW